MSTKKHHLKNGLVSILLTLTLATGLVPVQALSAFATEGDSSASTETTETTETTKSSSDVQAHSETVALENFTPSSDSGSNATSSDTSASTKPVMTSSTEKLTGSNGSSSQGASDVSENIMSIATPLTATGTSETASALINYNNLVFSTNEDGESVTLVGWTGDAPEGQLLVPAQILNGEKSYNVTAIRGAASDLPDDVANAINLYAIEFYANSDKAPKVTSVEIPASVTDIDVSFFQRFPAATEVNVRAGNPNFQSYNGMLFDAQLQRLLLVPEGMLGRCLLPNSLAEVPAGAFSRTEGLTSLAVDAKGSSAFASASGLLYADGDATLIAAPAGIGASAAIAPACTRIAEGAFWGCRDLRTIVASGIVKEIEAGSAADVAARSFGAQGEAAETAGSADGLAEGASEVAYFILPAFEPDVIANVKVALDIEPDARAEARAAWENAGFRDFAELPQADVTTYPKGNEAGFSFSVTDGGLAVSWQGDGKTDAPAVLDIPAKGIVDGVAMTVVEIAPAGFAGLEGLVVADLPDTIRTISASAFAGCSNLKTMHLGTSVETIGDRAFADCALFSLVLPASITRVDDAALAGMHDADIVVLGNAFEPDALTVHPNALDGASGVSVYVPYRADEDYGWPLGLPSAGNHLYPYGIQLADEPLSLEEGETADLYEGGLLEVPGAIEVSTSYRARSISIDTEAGTVTGERTGSSAIEVSLSLKVREAVVRDAHVSSDAALRPANATSPAEQSPRGLGANVSAENNNNSDSRSVGIVETEREALEGVSDGREAVVVSSSERAGASETPQAQAAAEDSRVQALSNEPSSDDSPHVSAAELTERAADSEEGVISGKTGPSDENYASWSLDKATGELLIFAGVGESQVGENEETPADNATQPSSSAVAAFPWLQAGTIEYIKSVKVEQGVKGSTKMAAMFAFCPNLSSFQLKNLTIPAGANLSHLFFKCPALKTVDLADLFNEDGLNLNRAFAMCSGLTFVKLDRVGNGSIATSNKIQAFIDDYVAKHPDYLSQPLYATDADGEAGSDFEKAVVDFYGALPADEKRNTSMHYMFYLCENLKRVELTDVGNGFAAYMYRMFYGRPALTTVVMNNVGNGNGYLPGKKRSYGAVSTNGKFVNMSSMFMADRHMAEEIQRRERTNLESISLENVGNGYGCSLDMMFYGSNASANSPQYQGTKNTVVSSFAGVGNGYRPSLSEFTGGLCSFYGNEDDQMRVSNFARGVQPNLSWAFLGAPTSVIMNDALTCYTINGAVADYGGMFGDSMYLRDLSIVAEGNSTPVYLGVFARGGRRLQTLKVISTNNEPVFDAYGLCGFAQGSGNLTEVDLSGVGTAKVPDANYVPGSISWDSTMARRPNMNFMFAGCRSLNKVTIGSFFTKIGNGFFQTKSSHTAYETQSYSPPFDLYVYGGPQTSDSVFGYTPVKGGSWVPNESGGYDYVASDETVAEYPKTLYFMDGSAMLAAQEVDWVGKKLMPSDRMDPSTKLPINNFYNAAGAIVDAGGKIGYSGTFNGTTYDGNSASWEIRQKDSEYTLLIYPTDYLTGYLRSFDSSAPAPWLSSSHKNNITKARIVGTLYAGAKMDELFKGLSNMAECDVSGLCEYVPTGSETDKTARYIESMKGMFADCAKLESISLTNIGNGKNLNLGSMDMFAGCSSLQSLEMANVGNGDGASMANMFQANDTLVSVSLRNVGNGNRAMSDKVEKHIENYVRAHPDYLSTDSAVVAFEDSVAALATNAGADEKLYTNMADMFYNCTSITSVTLDNVGNGYAASMYRMFASDATIDPTIQTVSMTNVGNGSGTSKSSKTSGYGVVSPTGTFTNMCRMFSAGKVNRAKYNSISAKTVGNGYGPSLDLMFYNSATGAESPSFVLSESPVTSSFEDIANGYRPSLSEFTSSLTRQNVNEEDSMIIRKLGCGVTPNGNWSFLGLPSIVKASDFFLFENAGDAAADLRNFCGYSGRTKEIEITGTGKGSRARFSAAFTGASSLVRIRIASTNDLPLYETTYMASMFERCSNLKEADLSGIDTKHLDYSGGAKPLNNMFVGCSSLSVVTIGKYFTRVGSDMFENQSFNLYVNGGGPNPDDYSDSLAGNQSYLGICPSTYTGHVYITGETDDAITEKKLTLWKDTKKYKASRGVPRVTYYIDGIQYITLLMEESGDAYKVPTAATDTAKAGYDIDGWYEYGHETMGEAGRFDFDATVETDVSLYGFSKARTYTIQFAVSNRTDGTAYTDVTNMPEPITVTYDSPWTITASDPEKVGYTFQGWSPSSDNPTSGIYKRGVEYKPTGTPKGNLCVPVASSDPDAAAKNTVTLYTALTPNKDIGYTVNVYKQSAATGQTELHKTWAFASGGDGANGTADALNPVNAVITGASDSYKPADDAATQGKYVYVPDAKPDSDTNVYTDMTTAIVKPDGSSVYNIYYKVQFDVTIARGDHASSDAQDRTLTSQDWGTPISAANRAAFAGATGYIQKSGSGAGQTAWKRTVGATTVDASEVPATITTSATYTAQWREKVYAVVVSPGDAHALNASNTNAPVKYAVAYLSSVALDDAVWRNLGYNAPVWEMTTSGGKKNLNRGTYTIVQLIAAPNSVTPSATPQTVDGTACDETIDVTAVWNSKITYRVTYDGKPATTPSERAGDTTQHDFIDNASNTVLPATTFTIDQVYASDAGTGTKLTLKTASPAYRGYAFKNSWTYYGSDADGADDDASAYSLAHGADGQITLAAFRQMFCADPTEANPTATTRSSVQLTPSLSMSEYKFRYFINEAYSTNPAGTSSGDEGAATAGVTADALYDESITLPTTGSANASGTVNFVVPGFKITNWKVIAGDASTDGLGNANVIGAADGTSTAAVEDILARYISSASGNADPGSGGTINLYALWDNGPTQFKVEYFNQNEDGTFGSGASHGPNASMIFTSETAYAPDQAGIVTGESYSIYDSDAGAKTKHYTDGKKPAADADGTTYTYAAAFDNGGVSDASETDAKALGSGIDSVDASKSTITTYRVLFKRQITLTFKAGTNNGGNGGVATNPGKASGVLYDWGDAILLPTVGGSNAIAPTNPKAFAFVGWSGYGTGDTAVKNQTFEAQWTPVEYALTFEDDPSSPNSDAHFAQATENGNQLTFTYFKEGAFANTSASKTDATFPIPAMNEGYRFMRWTATGPTSGSYQGTSKLVGAVDAGIFTEVEGSSGSKFEATVRIVCQEKTYTIVLDANDKYAVGGKNIASVKFTDATKISLGDNGLTNLGYAFDGWSASARDASSMVALGKEGFTSVRELYANKNVAISDATGPTSASGGAITLCAGWSMNKYRVLYTGKPVEANGVYDGDGNAMDATGIQPLADITIEDARVGTGTESAGARGGQLRAIGANAFPTLLGYSFAQSWSFPQYRTGAAQTISTGDDGIVLDEALFRQLFCSSASDVKAADTSDVTLTPNFAVKSFRIQYYLNDVRPDGSPIVGAEADANPNVAYTGDAVAYNAKVTLPTADQAGFRVPGFGLLNWQVTEGAADSSSDLAYTVGSASRQMTMRAILDRWLNVTGRTEPADGTITLYATWSQAATTFIVEYYKQNTTGAYEIVAAPAFDGAAEADAIKTDAALDLSSKAETVKSGATYYDRFIGERLPADESAYDSELKNRFAFASEKSQTSTSRLLNGNLVPVDPDDDNADPTNRTVFKVCYKLQLQAKFSAGDHGEGATWVRPAGGYYEWGEEVDVPLVGVGLDFQPANAYEHRFAGWLIDGAEAPVKLDATVTLTSSTSYVAAWREISYTIAYALNGPTDESVAALPSTAGIPGNKTVFAYADRANAKFAEATATNGYTFNGWFRDKKPSSSEDTADFDVDTLYFDTDEKLAGLFGETDFEDVDTPDPCITVYPKTSINNRYALRLNRGYDLVGESDAAGLQTTIWQWVGRGYYSQLPTGTADDEHKINEVAVAKRDHYDFEGYYLGEAADGRVTFEESATFLPSNDDNLTAVLGSDTPFTEQTTLYAKWAPHTFDVTLLTDAYAGAEGSAERVPTAQGVETISQHANVDASQVAVTRGNAAEGEHDKVVVTYTYRDQWDWEEPASPEARQTLPLVADVFKLSGFASAGWRLADGSGPIATAQTLAETDESGKRLYDVLVEAAEASESKAAELTASGWKAMYGVSAPLELLFFYNPSASEEKKIFTYPLSLQSATPVETNMYVESVPNEGAAKSALGEDALTDVRFNWEFSLRNDGLQLASAPGEPGIQATLNPSRPGSVATLDVPLDSKGAVPIMIGTMGTVTDKNDSTEPSDWTVDPLKVPLSITIRGGKPNPDVINGDTTDEDGEAGLKVAQFKWTVSLYEG